MTSSKEGRKIFKGTKKLNFILKGDKYPIKDDDRLVKAYSNADYAADRKSVSGGVFMVGGMILGLMCKK